MALRKLADFYPNYKKDIFAGRDIKGYDVYAGTTNDKLGTIHDALVDESGNFRYIVVDTGFWIFGKKVLLPVGQARFDYDSNKLYALGLTNKDQAESLPTYDDDMVVDADYEERVRNVYRSPKSRSTTFDRDNYSYERDEELYNTTPENHGSIKLYEERLLADKTRQKAGEVAVGKRVETETATASVPVENERVVIERTTPTNQRAVTPGEANFKAGEVARMEVYEEKAKIGKEAVVREEVSVRKEVDRETVTAEETLRREELDVDVDGKPIVNK